MSMTNSEKSLFGLWSVGIRRSDFSKNSKWSSKSSPIVQRYVVFRQHWGKRCEHRFETRHTDFMKPNPGFRWSKCYRTTLKTQTLLKTPTRHQSVGVASRTLDVSPRATVVKFVSLQTSSTTSDRVPHSSLKRSPQSYSLWDPAVRSVRRVWTV